MELTDAARGRGLVERWVLLSEQRLDHLTELFETGRWRRYFDEVAFLDNIQDAKRAVETWRGLLNREATRDNLPVDLSWLGRRSTLPPRRMSFLDQAPSEQAAAPILIAMMQPEPVSMPPVASIAPAEPQPWQQPSRDSVELEPCQDEAFAQQSAQHDSWQHALDPDRLLQRYPFLRNAF
jgi:uncharacterized repeat protein (TIGR03809 family)